MKRRSMVFPCLVTIEVPAGFAALLRAGGSITAPISIDGRPVEIQVWAEDGAVTLEGPMLKIDGEWQPLPRGARLISGSWAEDIHYP